MLIIWVNIVSSFPRIGDLTHCRIVTDDRKIIDNLVTIA